MMMTTMMITTPTTLTMTTMIAWPTTGAALW